MTSELAAGPIAAVIVGMAVINFGLRFVPIAVLSRLALPAPLMRWLSFVPISVMGALVASETLRPAGTWQPPLTNPGVWGAIASAVVFRLTQSFLGATLAGIVCFVAARAVL